MSDKKMNGLNNVIKFTSPGDFSKWEQECQPIGNAYMGASFFGGIGKEKIVLNEKPSGRAAPPKAVPTITAETNPTASPTSKKSKSFFTAANTKKP